MEEKTQSTNPDTTDIVPLPINNKTEETEDEESILRPKEEDNNEYEAEHLLPPPLPITETPLPIIIKKPLESTPIRNNKHQSRSAPSHLRAPPPLTPMSSIASDGSVIINDKRIVSPQINDNYTMPPPPVQNDYDYDYGRNGSVQNGNNRRNMMKHEMVQPIGRRLRFYCNVCGRSFSGKQHFEYHMRTHSGEKPFKCEQCGKAFRAKHSLKNHIRIHTGERPYQCKFCGKFFRQLGVMKNHTRNMHSNCK